jgi:hypothetical protein
MRFRLRTLLIVLALGPPVLAVAWWSVRTGALRRFDLSADMLAQGFLGFALVGCAVAAAAFVMARCAAAFSKR